MKHALLGASSSHRWLACTPSARLEETLPEEKSNYAEEGTLAHSVSEYLLREIMKEAAIMPMKTTPDMIISVRPYVNYVESVMKKTKNPFICLEKTVDYSAFVPEGSGTCDTIIISEGMLTVIDLKYGQGVEVSAYENSQLKLYALGAVLAYDCIFDIENVKMVICQPRLDSTSEFEMTVKDLLAWGESIREVARLAFAGEGEFVTGDHCRFCRAKGSCSARAEANLEIVRNDFAPPVALMTPDEIESIAVRADDVIAWLKDVQDKALSLALEGHEFSLLKLVEGRSNRKITNEEGLASAILSNPMYSEDQVFVKKIKGITELEKLVGKKAFTKVSDGFIDKPPGKPTLVSITDPRDVLSGTNINKIFEMEE